MKNLPIPSDEVSLQQFRALAAIAQTGSFTLAADALGLTQPAVSHLVKRMELEVGQPLVVRGRRIRLTDAGQLMADTAQRALRMIDETVRSCRSQAQLKEGRVMVAVGHLTAGALLPALLARFSATYPQLVATAHDSSAAQMVSMVLSREVDLALGSDIGNMHSDLATERLFTERMALFMRQDHALAGRPSVQGRDLDGLPMVHVNPEAVVWRAISRELSAVANVYPQVVQHVAMLSTAFGMIQAGMGLALLPRYVARLMPPDLRAVPIVRPVLEFPVVAIRLAKQPLSPAAMAFLAMARKHLRPSG
ncbi:LysR family transcriptional regulator [Hylemonella gracilis]|uniref:Transcriptional regulator lysr family protein n=1 Tax=Hylemonella gracilis ATCC 19624 TaxID=887062 RepID=F3KQG2_9BURK|nr:LysR substrate-binding domain-containing protein [Hylemonella gracilis]EGI77945.1 transcriptional regulator lysr family protein [Hylemonella gracilis ATCC 19624]